MDHRVGNWLGASLIATGQIVLGSEVLSELHAIGLPGFLGVHLVFLIGSILLARWKGTCPRIDDFVVSLAEIAAFARTHKLVVAFGLSLSTILILVVLPTSFVTGDAAHYHLPRAQYWIENQTARHFFTDYFPQVEYPPNTSFLYMWQIIVAGNYVALNLAQRVAAILTSMAIFALSIHGGHNSASSLFAGLIYLSLSGVVLQMSTPYDDILTAWLAASLIFFTLLAIDKFGSGRVDTARTHLLYSGIAFGLYLGAKLTAVFLLPGFGAVVAVALLRARANLVRNSILVGTGLLAGFLVFGYYN